MTNFKNINVGEAFYLVENGEHFRFEKVSQTEALLVESGIITDFSPEYGVHRA
jgi:hypothetical protein